MHWYYSASSSYKTGTSLDRCFPPPPPAPPLPPPPLLLLPLSLQFVGCLLRAGGCGEKQKMLFLSETFFFSLFAASAV